MKEEAEAIDSPPKPFISRLTVSKVANLGNYENRKIEISVNFSSSGAPVGNVLSEVEQIIDDINCLNGFDQFSLRQARNGLAKPTAEIDDFDVQRIPKWKEVVANYEELKARRETALEKLNQFGGTSDYRDAKTDWDDDEDYD